MGATKVHGASSAEEENELLPCGLNVNKSNNALERIFSSAAAKLYYENILTDLDRGTTSEAQCTILVRRRNSSAKIS